MGFNINNGYKKQYDWKFWIKLILGIIPIICIIVFFIGQATDLFQHNEEFWNFVIGQRWEQHKFNFGKYGNPKTWTTAQNIGYLISRNIFMLTTLGNIIASAFFINSAVNNKNEGKGKHFDNYRWGLMVVSCLMYIVIGYNGSLIFSGAIKIMKWYNYVSWLGEHSLIPLLMIIYFFWLYPKHEYKKNKPSKINKTKKWFSWCVSSINITVLYFIFFTILGWILRSTDAFVIFGDMSSSGYFPYCFMDWSNKDNLSVSNKGLFTARNEFIVMMVLGLVEQIVFFAWSYAVCEHQNKVLVNKEMQKTISSY